MKHQSLLALVLAGAILTFTGCETPQPQQPPPPPPPAAVSTAPTETTPPPVPPAAPAATVRQASWDELPAWHSDDPSLAWGALQESCKVLQTREPWREPCTVARQLARPHRDTARRFFESGFVPYQIVDAGGGTEGVITGYYEPLLRGSRKPSKRYRHALYGVPDDLLVIDLAEVHPELKGMQLRGRLDGRRVVPYHDRARIEDGTAAVRGRELVWVDDPVELFFLQIQGSGRIRLDDGNMLRVGYGDQNGHPYRSIGRLLVERKELPLEHASMQGIKAWARRNPGRLQELLNQNARYVFFRELPAADGGPPGALGVPLTAQRSIAVDPRFVPLGAPVYIATTWPNTTKPLNRLVLAQDTGGAIRGAIRADFFWGYGDEAGREAGRMRQPLKMWILWPRGAPPPRPNELTQ